MGLPSSLLAGGGVSEDQVRAFRRTVERRLAREPVAYITGSREFWSLPFAVGRGVLIPRPESETLIEQALREFPDRRAPLRMLDIGTGSGCLAVAFLKEYPASVGVAVEASPEAAIWAGRNIESHGLRDRCRLVTTSWTDGIEGEFDVILANPPYIGVAAIAALDPEVAGYEPHEALAGGCDGLGAYRALAPRIAAKLVQHGRALVELGADQACAVRDIFAAGGLETKRVAYDLSAIERCLVAVKRA
jgi:release factor glutamine methyltransferase